MMLLTKEIEKRFKEVGRQENSKDPIVIAKFFHPFSSWTWYATEYDENNREFYGYVVGDFPEWGSFALNELLEVKIHGLGMERDRGFRERPISEVVPEAVGA